MPEPTNQTVVLLLALALTTIPIIGLAACALVVLVIALG
jgi:hypothetical protein